MRVSPVYCPDIRGGRVTLVGAGPGDPLVFGRGAEESAAL